MGKPIRLSAVEHRTWSANVPQLVNKKGEPVVAVSQPLQLACSKIISLARNSQKSVKKTVKVVEKDAEGVSNTREIEIEARVKRVGINVNEIEIFCFVEGMLKASIRDIMLARFFKEHGACQILRPNGKFLKMVRDTRKKAAPKPDAGVVIRHAPEPHSCQCKAWGAPHPGRHHPVCEYNMMAPLHQRGITPGNDDNDKPIRPLPRGVQLAVKHVAPKPKVIPSPEDCVCADWEKPDKTKHHPICEHKTAWENLAANRKAYFLVGVDDQTVVREATMDESTAGNIAEKRTGQRLIDINNVMYALMTQEEVDLLESPSVEEDMGVIEEAGDDEGDYGEAVEDTERPTALTGAMDNPVIADEYKAPLTTPDLKAVAASLEDDGSSDDGDNILAMGGDAPAAETETYDNAPEARRSAVDSDGEGLVLPGMDSDEDMG